ncbi:nucleotide-sugar transporter-domain-containing protein [Protomyces lactucae-debilis]|uniref:Nucleotide-sugar transporter-domain-containing protein n=1 Tax=Protomyces lactucae-debilis TaxID=2754530 RepID=A0A1Y2FJ23_PROLT|nr:nucleotide-sugar transporter-domain-containing protein [Protomyces lactucae-debilis]ORY83256.1 nucleotide-sugar transporter-domain-containing protein [Protomyces lactucae-debilis]
MSALSAQSPSYKGIPLKYISLFTLTVQNSALILIMHYSRIMPAFQTKRYFTSTAVLSNEVLKLVLCVFLVWREQKQLLGNNVSLHVAIRSVITKEAWKLTIPAALYTLQNNLQYVAVSNLDAATFQVTYQLKIITTAIFSVTMLGRQLSLRKWLALVLLTGGIALVQLPTADMNRQVGLIAVVCACTLSGLAGVYFEKVLKGSRNSLWSLNLQLSFFSLFPALFIGVLWKDGAEVMQRGFFYGYNPVVWTAIIFQAAGGLIVAMCVAYADNIMKNFATSVSILISCIASVWFFDFVITSNVRA